MNGYERTESGFAKAFRDVKLLIRMHPKKSFWLFATNDAYHVSVIKPRVNELAVNTRANRYGNNPDEPVVLEFFDAKTPSFS